MTGETAPKTKLPEILTGALAGLTAAIGRLEAANERRAQAEAARTNLEEELAVMQDDRARLAVELDGALARVKMLELANEEAARRLGRAMAEIKALIAAAAGCDGQEAAKG